MRRPRFAGLRQTLVCERVVSIADAASGTRSVTMGKMLSVARKAGYVVVLIVLTAILFGPALPIDMAVLLASSLLFYGGVSTSWLSLSIVGAMGSRVSKLLMALRS